VIRRGARNQDAIAEPATLLRIVALRCRRPRCLSNGRWLTGKASMKVGRRVATFLRQVKHLAAIAASVWSNRALMTSGMEVVEIERMVQRLICGIAPIFAGSYLVLDYKHGGAGENYDINLFAHSRNKELNTASQMRGVSGLRFDATISCWP
jgi:hypothetical protein